MPRRMKVDIQSHRDYTRLRAARLIDAVPTEHAARDLVEDLPIDVSV